MKTYYIKFTGHYPVGAVAIVTAGTKLKAINSFKRELSKKGLLDKNVDLTKDDLIEIDVNNPNVDILLDGDY